MVTWFGVAAASFATGNIIGVGFGAMLVLHGTNSTQEGFKNIINHTDDAQGFLKKVNRHGFNRHLRVIYDDLNRGAHER